MQVIQFNIVLRYYTSTAAVYQIIFRALAILLSFSCCHCSAEDALVDLHAMGSDIVVSISAICSSMVLLSSAECRMYVYGNRKGETPFSMSILKTL